MLRHLDALARQVPVRYPSGPAICRHYAGQFARMKDAGPLWRQRSVDRLPHAGRADHPGASQHPRVRTSDRLLALDQEACPPCREVLAAGGAVDGTAPGWVNTTLAGVDISTVSGAEYRGGDITSPNDMAAGQGIGAFVAPALVPAHIATNRQVGVYAQNQTKIDDRFVIVLGGRRDRHRVDVRTSVTPATERNDASLDALVGCGWPHQAGRPT